MARSPKRNVTIQIAIDIITNLVCSNGSIRYRRHELASIVYLETVHIVAKAFQLKF